MNHFHFIRGVLKCYKSSDAAWSALRQLDGAATTRNASAHTARRYFLHDEISFAQRDTCCRKHDICYNCKYVFDLICVCLIGEHFSGGFIQVWDAKKKCGCHAGPQIPLPPGSFPHRRICLRHLLFLKSKLPDTQKLPNCTNIWVPNIFGTNPTI